MKRFLGLIICCVVFMSAQGQYYFTDIVANGQSQAQYKLLIAAKVSHVKATSYDAKGVATEGFGIEQDIKDGGKKIVTTTTIPNSSTTILENNYTNGRLVKSMSSNMQTFTTLSATTTYTYTDSGRVSSIVSAASDTAAATGFLAETHLWQYDLKGRPTQMLKIQTGKDTLKVVFTYDEKGYVAEEKWLQKGQLIQTYYYYYSEIGLLTDVVRFNERARKLLPDFIYEYDDDLNIVKMTQAMQDGSGYLVWQYTYNDKGLKESESCYNRQKQLQGKVVYEYSY